MPLRQPIPGTALSVSPFCLGAGGFGAADLTGAPVDRLVGAFLDAGGNFFDTAHCYGFWLPAGAGASERELGASLRRLGARGAVVATKGGHPEVAPDYPRPADFLDETLLRRDVDESRERLGVETIDLWYLHRDDGATPVGEVVERLNRLAAEGRIRHFGASNWSAERIAAAQDYARTRGLQGFVASQIQWSLATPTWAIGEDPTPRFVTDDDLALHRRTGLPIVAYSATAGGWFAGKPQAAGLYGSPVNEARRERARELAVARGATPVQVALAWLRRQPVPTIPLFSTSRTEHLSEVLAAADLALSPDEVRWLREGR